MAKAVTLEMLLSALPSAYIDLATAPRGTEMAVDSVAMLDPDDLRLPGEESADLTLLVGVSETDALGWFDHASQRSPGHRPLAVMTKVNSSAVRAAAREAGVALITVHARTRWERLLSVIRGVVDQPTAGVDAEHGLPGTDTDLYGLAQTVAQLTRGMVSIEDERSHVLAYSAADDAADQLRTLSILGREGPADYLRRLHDWGVFDRLRRTDDVIDVPADDEHGIRRRLAVGIRRISSSATTLGTIWVQEGAVPIAPDADTVLQGAAAVAARLITRITNAPTNEAVQIQRLLGARGGGVDVPSLAAALSIPTSGPAAVIGFAALGDAAVLELAPSIRLHASAFRRDSLVTTIGDRIYVLFPALASSTGVGSWTADVIERIERRTGTGLRAAIASPITDLDSVATARSEVDRVLDSTTGEVSVTTLADSRTSVLLAEILDLIGRHEQLHDPRIDILGAYDARHSSTMRVSCETYLRHFGDVRSAAAELLVHPNTLRYRIGRVEQILGVDLTDPDVRLLMELQLRLWR